jgi:hypothetical protein
MVLNKALQIKTISQDLFLVGLKFFVLKKYELQEIFYI